MDVYKAPIRPLNVLLLTLLWQSSMFQSTLYLHQSNARLILSLRKIFGPANAASWGRGHAESFQHRRGISMWRKF